MDVTCSTSSILNLVAISIDRYIAVTKPIRYAKHKNNRRVWLTIALVWAISAAVGSPIVLGLNNTPDRMPDHCLFYNSDFIIYSSLTSFYIPCLIMVFLYYNIFRALSNRAKRARAARRPNPEDIRSGCVIENVAQTRRLAETALGTGLVPPATGLDEDRPTNTGSGSQEEEDELDNVDDCHVIPNDKSTEFILATVTEETAMAVSLACPATLIADPNGNNDSGYAASNLEEMALQTTSLPNSPSRRRSSPNTDEKLLLRVGVQGHMKKNGAATIEEAADGIRSVPPVLRTESIEDSAVSGSKKEKKASAASRFTIYKVNKASKKKREKSSAKKERKATKTLAIVLGVFLVCWVPFFSFNIKDAVCTKLSWDCNPGVTTFILTTWLGYMNSFVNPIIYTIFNPEFRKAFKKIMCLGT